MVWSFFGLNRSNWIWESLKSTTANLIAFAYHYTILKEEKHLVINDRFQDGKLWTSLKVTMERWEGQISKQYGTPMLQPMAQQIVQPMVQSMAHPIIQLMVQLMAPPLVQLYINFIEFITPPYSRESNSNPITPQVICKTQHKP